MCSKHCNVVCKPIPRHGVIFAQGLHKKISLFITDYFTYNIKASFLVYFDED